LRTEKQFNAEGEHRIVKTPMWEKKTRHFPLIITKTRADSVKLNVRIFQTLKAGKGETLQCKSVT